MMHCEYSRMPVKADFIAFTLLLSLQWSVSSAQENQASLADSPVLDTFFEMDSDDDPRKGKAITTVDANGLVKIEFCGNEEILTIEIGKLISVDTDCSGHRAGTWADLSKEDFVGALIYSYNNLQVGKIEDVTIGDDNDLSAVIDVGGFLGLGEKPVSLELGMLDANLVETSTGDRKFILNESASEILYSLIEENG